MHDEAAASYRAALTIQPWFIGACANLANVLRNLGRFDAALECWTANVSSPQLSRLTVEFSNAYLFISRISLNYTWRSKLKIYSPLKCCKIANMIYESNCEAVYVALTQSRTAITAALRKGCV